MPRLISTRPVAVCALALFMTLAFAGVASATKVSSELRVVAGGKVLDEETLSTGTTKVPTSSKATCFGRHDRGSGKSATVTGPTAFGLLAQAARSSSALRPFYVTDAFSFGLGLCTVGGHSATKKLSWYLKVNHKGSEVGGDAVKLKEGDEVLWALTSYPYPRELSLVAPFNATPGVPFEVSVFSYDEKGKRRPDAGATVTGATAPTDSAGKTSVVLSSGTLLRATHGKDIPSGGSYVGMCTPTGACPVP
jgi:hypothetical protein